MKSAIILLFVLAALQSGSSAQVPDYSRIDNKVEALGALTELNLARIADTICMEFSGKKEKARAIFYWIANNITLDPKAIRNNDQKKDDPEVIIASRKGTPKGMAGLFQEMSSLQNIRCLTVDGYSKFTADDISEKPDEWNHTWNVIQLGQSPSEWHYVDVAKAAGHLDAKGNNFIKEFSSGYFFPDRKLFNLDHFPDNMAWQLGPGPKKLSEFLDLPVIGPAAYELQQMGMDPFSGKVKAKANRSFTFKIIISPFQPLSNMEMMTGTSGKRTAPQPLKFTNAAGVIEFSCIFYDEDEFPLTIIANGKTLAIYQMVVTE